MIRTKDRTAEKKPSGLRSIMNVIMTVSSVLGLASTVTGLMELQAAFSGKKLQKAVILFIMFGVSLIMTWASLSGLLFIGLTELNFNDMTALLCVTLLNALLLIIFSFKVYKNKMD